MSSRQRSPGQRVVLGAGLAAASAVTAARTAVHALSGQLLPGMDTPTALRVRHLAVAVLFALIVVMAVRQATAALGATPPNRRRRLALLAGGVAGGLIVGAPLLALVAVLLLVFLSAV